MSEEKTTLHLKPTKGFAGKHIVGTMVFGMVGSFVLYSIFSLGKEWYWSLLMGLIALFFYSIFFFRLRTLYQLYRNGLTLSGKQLTYIDVVGTKIETNVKEWRKVRVTHNKKPYYPLVLEYFTDDKQINNSTIGHGSGLDAYSFADATNLLKQLEKETSIPFQELNKKG